MNKKWLFIISLFVLVSCKTSEKLDQKYFQILDEVKQTTKFDLEYPFDIQVNQYQKQNKYEYSVIIDNFKQKLDKIKVLVYDKNQPHKEQDEIFANIGILGNDNIIGIPKEEDKIENTTKGIILNQESDSKEINLIIYVSYQINQKEFKKIIEVSR